MFVQYIFRKRTPVFHSIEQVFSTIIPLIEGRCETEIRELPNAGAGFSEILGNLRNFRRAAPDAVYHITGHANYMAICTGRRTVLTIHDMGSALTGNYPARVIKLLVWFWIPALIAKRITIISEFSRKEFRKRVPFAGKKTVVIPNPVDPSFLAAGEQRRLSTLQNTESTGSSSPLKPRILLVGTKPNKNLSRTLEALAGLQVRLIVIGPVPSGMTEFMENHETEYLNHVHTTQDGLLDCYRTSDLLCYASLYEGFGMPIIEAQAAGVPVLTSNRGAMKEIAGDGAHLVDPEDESSIRAGVQKILENHRYRRMLIRKGFENIERFRADVVAERYMEVYNEILAG